MVWIDYFHFAIYLGVVLFLAWIYRQCGIPNPRRRAFFLASAAAFCALSYLLVCWGIYCYFGRGWAGMALDMVAPDGLPRPLRWLIFNSVYFSFALIPLAFWALSRAFGVLFQRNGLVKGYLAYLLAIPVAIFVLTIIPHPGTPDTIHAIKTGFCIPLLMIGLGLPFCFRQTDAGATV